VRTPQLKSNEVKGVCSFNAETTRDSQESSRWRDTPKAFSALAAIKRACTFSIDADASEHALSNPEIIEPPKRTKVCSTA
jgi:hypothetical protein